MLDRNVEYGGHGMWNRAVYRKGFLDRSITAVVRPGDRSDPTKPTGLPVGEDLLVRFIKKPGDQAKGVKAEFFPDEGITVSVTECVVRKIGDLSVEDLRGVSPDTATAELVKYHLGMIYNTELPGDNDLVTIWRFEYRPDAVDPSV